MRKWPINGGISCIRRLATFADRYDAIGIEDISVKAMAKRKKGGKFSFGKSGKRKINRWI